MRLWRATILTLLLGVSSLAQQTIHWKKDHIMTPDGTVIATATPQPVDQTAPTAPSGLVATQVTARSVNLAWTGSTDTGGSGLAGYKIYRGNIPIAVAGAGTLTFTDFDLQPGAEYTYTVVAFDDVQNHSVASNTVQFTTTPGVNLQVLLEMVQRGLGSVTSAAQEFQSTKFLLDPNHYDGATYFAGTIDKSRRAQSDACDAADDDL